MENVMNKLFVRVNPKSGNTQFYRCAMLFTLAWLAVDVDGATKQRLEEEQMLETSETEPEDYVAHTEEVKQEVLGFVDDTSTGADPATVAAIVSTANSLAEVLGSIAPATAQVDATQIATQTEGATTTTQVEEKPTEPAAALTETETAKPAPAAKAAPAKSTAKAKAAPVKAAPTAKGAK